MKFGEHVEGIGETALTSVALTGIYLYPAGEFDLVFVGKKKAKPKGAIRLSDVKKIPGKPPANLLKQARTFAERSLPQMKKWLPKEAEELERQLSIAMRRSTAERITARCLQIIARAKSLDTP